MSGPLLPAFFSKKCAQQVFGFLRANSVIDVRRVMRLRVAEHPCAMGDAAGLRIRCCVIHPRDTCRGNGSCTHRARLKRNVKIMPRKTFRPDGRAGCADCQHFGVGRGVVQFTGSIACNSDHGAGRGHDNGSDRHLAATCGGPRGIQSLIHVTAKNHVLHMPPNPALSQGSETG